MRGFNRFYTGRLGLLNTDYLRDGWTLAAARVLYEIAHRHEATARSIAKDLQLDEAYLSRILATFERRKLIRRTVSPSDARQRTLALTSPGRRAFAELDQAAAAEVTASLASLAPTDRNSLVESMARIQRLLEPAGGSAAIRLRALEVGDIGWIIHRQARLYAEEYGWDLTYEGLIAEIMGEFVKRRETASDDAWIAERGGEIVGSVFLVRGDATVAKLRLLYVEPSARGLGVGRRLVEECVRGAKQRGYGHSHCGPTMCWYPRAGSTRPQASGSSRRRNTPRSERNWSDRSGNYLSAADLRSRRFLCAGSAVSLLRRQPFAPCADIDRGTGPGQFRPQQPCTEITLA